MFANSSDETKTATEKAFTKQFLEQIGNIGKILISVVFAVFFTMLLVTANTMAQSVRERTNEIGVLKTLGFSSGSVLRIVIGEALFLTIVGGLIGFGLAYLAVGGMQPMMKKYFPGIRNRAEHDHHGIRAHGGARRDHGPVARGVGDASQDHRRAAARLRIPHG